jgi:hypothetical protein
MREAHVVNEVLLAVGGDPRYRVHRQNAGKVFAIDPDQANEARAAGFTVRAIQLAPAGSADIVGIAPGGRYLEIECKMPGEKPRPNQMARCEVVRTRGGIYIVARSGAEALEALEREA